MRVGSCFLAVVVLSGIGLVGRSTASAQELAPLNIQGKWNWVAKDSTTGTVELFQNAKILAGFYTDSSGIYALIGNVDGKQIKFGVAYGKDIIRFQAMLDDLGGMMGGARLSTGKDWLWKATKVPGAPI